MIKSMTGFGKAANESQENGSFSVEVKSVNNRYLDINVRLPKSMNALEDKVRKLVSSKVNRGKVDVSIIYVARNNSNEDVSVNMDLAEKYTSTLRNMQSKLNLKDDISVSLISSFPDVITITQKEDNLDLLWDTLSHVIEDAVDKNIHMRSVEGGKLEQNIKEKCEDIRSMLDNVSSYCEESIVNYQKRLYTRVSDMLKSTNIDDSRIVEETAIYADKVDVDEEITRFYSHLDQMKETLNLNEPVGRKMDFIIQEMNREANTIASKSISIEITNIVINIKNILEKIREQVQNIE